MPKGKVILERATGEIKVTIVEDIDQRDADETDNSDYMSHVFGNWSLNNTYWLNFHQTKTQITHPDHLTRFLEAL